MNLRDRLRDLWRPNRFGSEERNIRGGILFIVSGSIFVALLFLIAIHALDPGFDFFGPAFYCLCAVALSLVCLYFSQLTVSSYLLVLSLLGFVLYQLAFQVNGIHETAILVIPGILIIAGLLLRKWEYILFTIIIIISIAIIIWREDQGLRQTPFSANESSYFGFDILVIISVTAFAIGIITASYLRNLRQARESEARMKELNSTKDRFFSIISHDLRSPFNNILGLSEILQQEASALHPETVEQYAGMLNRSAQHTYQLLENLLEWARLQQGTMPFNPSELSIRHLIDKEMAGLKFDADSKNITLRLNLTGDFIFTADGNMIRSVIRNLLANAIKFTSREGWVEVNVVKTVCEVVITVSDNGIGMNRETIAGLFHIETASSTPGTEKEKGHGLGLILCREFIEKHGGQISAASRPGEGSTFTFTIPQ